MNDDRDCDCTTYCGPPPHVVAPHDRMDVVKTRHSYRPTGWGARRIADAFALLVCVGVPTLVFTDGGWAALVRYAAVLGGLCMLVLPGLILRGKV